MVTEPDALESSPGPPADSELRSFAVDLLGAFEAAKKKNQRSVRICEELASMIRLRAAAEEEYAKSLQRVAALTEGLAEENEDDPESTFMEGVSALRADLLKKGTQHTLLANQLLLEVLDPIMQFKNQLATQSKDLNDRASQLGKTARSLEQKYRSSHQRFERAYQAAAAACSQIIDLGGTPPKAPDPHLIYKKYGLDKVPRQTNHHSPSGGRGASGSKGKEESGSRLKSLTAGTASTAAHLITQVARTDLTSWLLPTEKERLQDLLASARDSLEQAELCRFSCREQYESLTVYAKEATHHLQVLLSEYQMLEERCVDELKVVMRKQVVVESSAVANQQYDLQMIFKLLEEIDHDRDLHAFISTHATPYPGMDITNVLACLSSSPPAPLPPPPPGLGADQPIEDPTTAHPDFPVVSPSDVPSPDSLPADEDDMHAGSTAVSPRVAPASSILRLLVVPSPSSPVPSSGVRSPIVSRNCSSSIGGEDDESGRDSSTSSSQKASDGPSPATAIGEAEQEGKRGLQQAGGLNSSSKVEGAAQALRQNVSPTPVETSDGAVEWSI